MRTLSRPMFNMGGPIKEGVMHGIREPYRHGRRVGYKDGGWGDYFKNIFTKSKPLVKQVVGKKLKPVVGAIDKIAEQKWLQSLHPSRIKQTISGIPGSAPGQTFIQNLKSFPGISKIPGWATKAKDLAVKYPKSTIAGGVYGGPLVIEAGKNIPWSGIGGFLDPRPGWRKAFGIEEEEKITDKDGVKSIQENIAMKMPPGGGETAIGSGAAVGGGKEFAEAKATKLAKAEKDKRINNLLEIMGYDKSKKDATYDALIDASQIISQAPGGKSLDISRDIIQPVIGAASKRFDKPKQLDEAVRLMMTKAEIEKEMNPLDSEVKRWQIEGYKKQLAGTNFKEAVLAASKDGQASGSKLASLARQYLPGDFKVMQIKVPKKTDTLEHIIDIVKESHTNPDKDPFPPGQYVLKERVVSIDHIGNVTPLDV